MSAIPLKFGPLSADALEVHRSGVRLLVQPGQYVRPNQVFAYCNINFEPAGTRRSGAPNFAEETDLQVGFAARVGGRISVNPAMVKGGYLDVLGVDVWNEDAVLGSIDAGEDASGIENAGQLRLLMLAGRRMSGLTDVHPGLLNGWHSRTRGWWCDQGETPVTLLSMGICDAFGVVLGEHCAFLEMFEAAPMAAQMVFVPAHPLAPTAPVLLDQLNRTSADYQAISADLRAFLGRTNVIPTGDDWMVAGTLLAAMQRSPISDAYDLFSPAGTQRVRPADAVLLSLAAEPQSILRHKTLGYHMHMMRHHQAAAGPAIRAWLSSAFEPVKRSINDIAHDYDAFLSAVREKTGATVMVINRMSTSGYEDISSYVAFDAPMSDTLANIAAKELNLVLHDLADTHDLAIIDADALGADLGGAEHLPDGIHQSGQIQAALRQEILHVLSDVAASQVTSNSTGRSAASALPSSVSSA